MSELRHCPALDLSSATQAPSVMAAYRSICPEGEKVAVGIPLGGYGYLAVMGYDEVRHAAMDTTRLSSAEGMTILPLKTSAQLIPVELDPPDHAKYRRFLMPYLRKDRIDDYTDEIRLSVDEAIDTFRRAARSRPELHRALCSPRRDLHDPGCPTRRPRHGQADGQPERGSDFG